MVRRTVKAHPKGESLSTFARRHGVDADDLARWNKIPVQTTLRPSQVMTLMSPAQAQAVRKHASKPPAKTAARKGQAARPAPAKAETRGAQQMQRR
jgi:LysM repeat protein